jgi:hypothetical protein
MEAQLDMRHIRMSRSFLKEHDTCIVHPMPSEEFFRHDTRVGPPVN